MNKKIKSVLCFALSGVALFSSVFPAFAFSKGDVDGNGEIAASDARLALRVSVKLEEISEEQKKAADMDDSGDISSADARAILRLAVGLSDVTPVDPLFAKNLFEVSRGYLGKKKSHLPPKWCCIYTFVDVFRPVLEMSGYSEAEINLLCPRLLYAPSLYADYYLTTPAAAETTILYEYYDDITNNKVMERTDNADMYRPRVGDILFMSNKTKTYHGEYPTIDHTAQIIKVYENGTFLCTEGSIKPSKDEEAQVVERLYKYNPQAGTYEWQHNSVIVCLMVARPNL